MSFLIDLKKKRLENCFPYVFTEITEYSPCAFSLLEYISPYGKDMELLFFSSSVVSIPQCAFEIENGKLSAAAAYISCASSLNQLILIFCLCLCSNNNEQYS